MDEVAHAEFGELPSQEEMFGALMEAAQRITALEAKVAEQDHALRRTLTLLIEWIEGSASR